MTISEQLSARASERGIEATPRHSVIIKNGR